MERRLEAGEIARRLGEIIGANVVPGAVALAALVAFNVALDMTGVTSGVTFLSSFASLVAQYYLTDTALVRLELKSKGGKSRFFAFWGANLLSSLGILFFLLLLIVPGVYYAARWSIVAPALLVEDLGAAEALTRSWARTRRNAWIIVGALVLLFLPLVAVVLAISFGIGDELLQSVLLNLILFAGLCVGWWLAVALYSLLADPRDDLAAVFA